MAALIIFPKPGEATGIAIRTFPTWRLMRRGLAATAPGMLLARFPGRYVGRLEIADGREGLAFGTGGKILRRLMVGLALVLAALATFLFFFSFLDASGLSTKSLQSVRHTGHVGLVPSSTLS